MTAKDSAADQKPKKAPKPETIETSIPCRRASSSDTLCHARLLDAAPDPDFPINASELSLLCVSSARYDLTLLNNGLVRIVSRVPPHRSVVARCSWVAQ